ncbi:MAG: glutathione S-transferase family protein [Alphaproteobacteria bacterium]|nr:glutathione S-transferase family protein [Alphaproteobacteria bacterium]
MILIGRYLSPFVRRVGISLTLAGTKFDRLVLSTVTDREKLLKVNPLGRVPALILGKGKTAEVLVDSTAILDHVDEDAGPRRALTPAKGAPRRRVQKIVFLALGTLEKAVGALYEKTRRPAEKVHQPWLDQLESQVTAGLETLNAIVPKPYLAGPKLTQADVTAAVLFGFLRRASPHLVPEGRYKRLEAHAKKLEKLPAFQACQPEQP